MIPVTRKELYLNKIVGNDDYSVPEKPISEEELFFAEILGEAVQAPEPLTRYQMYLAKIAGRDIEIPYPKTRLEYFLAKAAGMDITVPVPITREEIYWSNYTAIVEFEIENTPPLTYKAIEGTLKNYRIYGNTVNGNSVGDRTANLFDDKLSLNASLGTLSSEPPILCFPYTTGGDRKTCFLTVTPGEQYTISMSTPGDRFGICGYYNIVDPHEYTPENKLTSDEVISPIMLTSVPSTYTFTVPNNVVMVAIYYSLYMQPTQFQIEKGSTATPYEPYGYKVPVTVNSGTVNIYLDEQIVKSGDDADYIDYATQKRYNADGTTVDVELPTLQTVEGTNTLSVGTEVQPSKVYVKYEGARE